MATNPPILTAREIADYFLAMVDEDVGDNLTNLKLQKLLYYAQGFHLAMHGLPLFGDGIVAWQHGPVIPELYREFRQHGAAPISGPEGFDHTRYPEEVREILDEVWSVYGQFSAWRLRDMTHAEPPWQDTPINGEINHRAMADYFKTLLVGG